MQDTRRKPLIIQYILNILLYIKVLAFIANEGYSWFTSECQPPIFSFFPPDYNVNYTLWVCILNPGLMRKQDWDLDLITELYYAKMWSGSADILYRNFPQTRKHDFQPVKSFTQVQPEKKSIYQWNKGYTEIAWAAKSLSFPWKCWQLIRKILHFTESYLLICMSW